MTDFVANELLVETSSSRSISRLLRRWNGRLLATTETRGAAPVHLVRINTSRANPAGLPADLRRLDPRSRGRLRVSSAAGLRLLAAAADEAAAGARVGINMLATPTHEFLDRLTYEAALPTGDTLTNYTQNPFHWKYMTTGGVQKIGVAEAWRSLELARKLSNRVRIAVIDRGFAPSKDFSPASTGATGVVNAGVPLDKLWHGTEAAMTAGAVAGNYFGTAGSAGPVGDLRMIGHGGAPVVSFFEVIDGIYEAFENGARVINMSFKIEFDAVFSFAAIPLEDATQEARERGSLPFAGAGNDGDNVDAEDCFIACWEEEWIAPCENQGVICVGGLANNSTSRHPASNHGAEHVDIFAPFEVFAGPTPEVPKNHIVEGTSFASPFAAGVAALIWAADPRLSDDRVADLLISHAHPSPDRKVRRYVDALGSVGVALGAVPPLVTIDSPANEAHVGYDNGTNSVQFAASRYGLIDALCCTVSWAASGVGPLGEGTLLKHSFERPGRYVIAATAQEEKLPKLLGGFVGGRSSTATITLFVDNDFPIPYNAPHWRVREVAHGGLEGFENGPEPPGFATVHAPFGSGGFCELQNSVFRPNWNVDTDLLLRRTIYIPSGTSDVKLRVAVDNDFVAFWNGTEIANQMSDNCPAQDMFVPVDVADSLLDRNGPNLLAIRAIDRGDESFFDAQITGSTP